MIEMTCIKLYQKELEIYFNCYFVTQILLDVRGLVEKVVKEVWKVLGQHLGAKAPFKSGWNCWKN